HDVLGRGAAPVEEDHRRASRGQGFAALHDALSVSDAQCFPSMPTTGAFTYSNPGVIHWGAGSIAQLGAELQRLAATRLGVVTTRSPVESPDRLRVRHAATVVIGRHAPTAQARAATTTAQSAGAE